MSTPSTITIRRARPDDAPAITAIHAHGVEDGEATFSDAPWDAAAVRNGAGDADFSLVAELEGRVVGFARAIRSDDRCAAAGVGEYAVYVDRGARGRGIGTTLLPALCDAAQAVGYWKLIGRIFTSNAASVELARRCGFGDVGVHVRHGRLAGEWKDVLVVEKLLGDAADPDA